MKSQSFLGYSPLGFHRIAYSEWGTKTNRPPIICVHGLTRQGHDFDVLAETLQHETQIFCPDIVGRGKSDWLSNPDLYTYPQYLADMVAMIARVAGDQKSVDWVGTSMGGIIGMFLAAADQTPIRRLVINDVGPFIAYTALKRIGDYIVQMPEFSTLEEGEQFLRKIYASFGPLSDENWRRLTAHSYRALSNGKYVQAYDPGICKNFMAVREDIDFWNIYDRITCPTLVLHGKQSDVLSQETAEAMTKRGPKAQLVEFPHTGHAPALMNPTQIKIISEFLSN